MKYNKSLARSIADEAAILTVQARAEHLSSQIALGMVELARLKDLADRSGFELTETALQMAKAAPVPE